MRNDRCLTKCVRLIARDCIAAPHRNRPRAVDVVSVANRYTSRTGYNVTVAYSQQTAPAIGKVVNTDGRGVSAACSISYAESRRVRRSGVVVAAHRSGIGVYRPVAPACGKRLRATCNVT